MVEVTEAGLRAFLDGLIARPLFLRALDENSKSVGQDVPLETTQWIIQDGMIICAGIEVIAEQAGCCLSYQIIRDGEVSLMGYLDSVIEYVEADILMMDISWNFDSGLVSARM